MYNTSTKIISAPIGIVADIAKALGVASGDLGYLCSNNHGKTKKWSRFKPIQYEGLDLHLKADYDNGGTLYRGKDDQCGLNIPYTTSIKSSADKYFNGEMAWGYNAPEPNSTYPARALDFDGYYSDATPPIDASTVTNEVWLENHNFTLGLDVVTTGTTHNLGLNDINVQLTDNTLSNLTEWYPGLLFKKEDDSSVFAITSDDIVGEGFNISFKNEATNFPGTWKVVPFLSPIKVNTLTGDEEESKYIGMDVEPFNITIYGVGELQYGISNAYWVEPEEGAQYRYVGYTVDIINNDSSERTFRLRLNIGYSPNGTGNDLINTTHVTLPNAITIPSNGTKSIESVDIDETNGYPLLDIGTTLQEPLNHYYCFVSVGVDSATGIQWKPTPLDKYTQLEEPIK